MDSFIRKVTSRKFLLSAAAFIAALCTGAAGVLPPDACVLGMALSAGIYAACEAYVDGKREASTTTSTSVTATASATTSKEIVAKVLGGENGTQGN